MLWNRPSDNTYAILESEVLSREIGDAWLQRRRAKNDSTVAMQVPSAIIPQEWNYLIDPLSLSVAGVHWSDQTAFRIDPRLVAARLR